jgi:hypothetical protein
MSAPLPPERASMRNTPRASVLIGSTTVFWSVITGEP